MTGTVTVTVTERRVLRGLEATFRAAVVAFVPDCASLDEAGWREVEDVVVSALALRPAAMRRQLRVFVRLLDVLSFARYGRRLSGLDLQRRGRLLEALERSWVRALRQGVWGLRTLAMMGFYARPAGASAIGYRADPRGWSARS